MGIESGASSVIGATLQGVGTVLGAKSAYSSSASARRAYQGQAQVARNNAELAQWQADAALARGDRDVSLVRGKTQQIKGSQRAALAASGVDLSEGSALNILSDTEYFGEIDVATTLENAANEAWVLRRQAMGFSAEAIAAQTRAAAERPWMAAGTSLLTGAGRVADRWYEPRATQSRTGNRAAASGDGLSQGERRKLGVF